MNWILLAVSMSAGLAAAQAPEAGPAPAVSTAPAEVTYNHGMRQRGRGEYAAAKKTFLELLEKNPGSGGALEGLSLACLGLGEYEEAAMYLGRWNEQAPGKPYVLGLLQRARRGAADERGELAAAAELAALDPRDCAARQRVEALSERAGNALLPRARAYRAVSIEDLASGNPQKIIYEGASAGARFRAPYGRLDLFGGVEIRTEAQRNAGRGFDYFEVQEQVYTAGLTGRFRRGWWEAEASHSVFADISSTGGDPEGMLRGRVSLRRGSEGLELSTQPRLVRVAGGGRFYRLMREASARAESSRAALGWDWYGRAGVNAISGGRTLGTAYLRGARDLGWSALTASYSHGQQEFYNAAASGRLRYVQTDRFGAALSRGEQGGYKAWAGAFQSYYSDANKLLDTGLELTGWLPWQNEFYGLYRYSNLDFRLARAGYDNLDEIGHWLGAGWRRCAGRNWSAGAGYEHGYVTDSLVSYHADVYTAEAEWYSARGSVKLTGRRRTASGRGHSWSAGLQARYNF